MQTPLWWALSVVYALPTTTPGNNVVAIACTLPACKHARLSCCLYIAQGTLATARSLFGSPAAAAAFADGTPTAGTGWQLSDVTVDSTGELLLALVLKMA